MAKKKPKTLTQRMNETDAEIQGIKDVMLKHDEAVTVEQEQQKCTHPSIKVTISREGCVECTAKCYYCNKELTRIGCRDQHKRSVKRIFREFAKN